MTLSLFLFNIFILINYFTIIFSNAIFLVYICIFTNLFDYLCLYMYIYLLINVILVLSSSITHLFFFRFRSVRS